MTVTAGLAQEVRAIAQHPGVRHTTASIKQRRPVVRSRSDGWEIKQRRRGGGTFDVPVKRTDESPRLEMYPKVWDNNLFVIFRLKLQTSFHFLG